MNRDNVPRFQKHLDQREERWHWISELARAPPAQPTPRLKRWLSVNITPPCHLVMSLCQREASGKLKQPRWPLRHLPITPLLLPRRHHPHPLRAGGSITLTGAFQLEKFISQINAAENGSRVPTERFKLRFSRDKFHVSIIWKNQTSSLFIGRLLCGIIVVYLNTQRRKISNKML